MNSGQDSEFINTTMFILAGVDVNAKRCPVMKQVESQLELFQEGAHVNQTEKSTPFIFATGEI